MSKFSNMLVMINLLKTGKKYSVKDLSERLEVSERIVREYKVFLEEAGIYLETIRGPYGGYVLNRDISMPNLKFNKQDVDLLTKCILNECNVSISEKLKNLKNKINYAVIDNESKNEKLLTNDEMLKKYNIFSKAIKYNLKIKIKYKNLQHGISERTIYPLSLYLFQGEWWSSCYWEEKDDMRQFHLIRIVNVELLKEHFDPNLINIKF